MKRRAPNDPADDAIAAVVKRKLERILCDGGLDDIAVSLSQKIATFASHLALWGSKINLTASPTDPDEILFHVMDSLAPFWIARKQPDSVLGRVLGDGCRLMDVGSGAGFPGLILAAATGLETVLLEARRKRVSFLKTVAAAMELPNVTIVHTRGTPSSILMGGFDLITIRAVGVMPEFFELARMALRPGGIALAYLAVAQEIDNDAASASGLTGLLSPRYEMSRGGEKIARALALWLKES
ncbi:MAG: 16S rRNA (guanine(527)-N(7))-methyltransferase RsmG [Candidatus Binataceae bacterium]